MILLPKSFDSAKTLAARYGAPRFEAATKKKIACLYIYDAIGADLWGNGITPSQVVEALASARNDGATDLEVYVNSPGGYVFDGFAIYNEIRRWDGPKTVYVDGVAASIASVIALAGDKVVTSSVGAWMVHRPWGGVIGNADDMRKTADDLDKIGGVLLDTYARETGSDRASLDEWVTAETWMTAEEALARGFTDEIANGDAAPKKAAASIKTTPERLMVALMRADTIRAACRPERQGLAPAPNGSTTLSK